MVYENFDKLKILGKVCKNPFKRIEIYANGKCGCCCPVYTNSYFFGSVFDKSADEIWNGDLIKTFRKSVLDGSWTYCNLASCQDCDCKLDDGEKYSEVMTEFPETVDLSIDGHCNFRCVYCRDVNFVDKKYYPKMKEIIDTKIIPLLANCKELDLNGNGEFFVSEICQDLVRKTVDLYPQLKYSIITNGSLCTLEKLDSLKILKGRRLAHLSLSLHAMSSEVHEKITRSGNTFEQVIKNIKSILRHYHDEEDIIYVSLNFVISSINYKELPLMAEFCIENNVVGNFWEFRNWKSSAICEEYDKYNVTDPKHPEYLQLKELLQDEKFNHKKIVLNGVLQQVRNS